MIRQLAAAFLLTVLGLIAVHTGEAHAQTVQTQRGPALDSMQASIVKAIAAQNTSVEISIDGPVLIALRVNSNLNDSTHAGRNNEANAIAKVASEAVVANKDYAVIHTIKVQYVKRDSAGAVGQVIDTVEFRKNAKGVFEMHVS